jgi:hypothetical protein
MPTIIKTKNSVTATNAPSSLQQGEVAINITDKKVWVGNAATTPILLLGSGADGTFTNLSVTGVATFGAGTVSLPSITTTGDTNTGIFFPAADTIAFTEGGVESMRIDSSGNVGIGTATPSTPLNIVRNAAGAQKVLFSNNSSGSSAETAFSVSNGTAEGSLRVAGGSYGGYGAYTANNTLVYNDTSAITIMADNASNGIIKFATGGNSERMRIDSSGNLLVGTTSATAGGVTVRQHIAGNEFGLGISVPASGAQQNIRFVNGTTAVGSVTTTSSLTSYNVSSDRRLKENITPLTTGLASVLALKPSQYNYKADPTTLIQGFIADELQQIVPHAVSGEANAVDKDGKPVYQGVDASFLIPFLVSAIQELNAKITALENK